MTTSRGPSSSSWINTRKFSSPAKHGRSGFEERSNTVASDWSSTYQKTCSLVSPTSLHLPSVSFLPSFLPSIHELLKGCSPVTIHLSASSKRCCLEESSFGRKTLYLRLRDRFVPFLSTIPSPIRSFPGINAAPRMNLAHDKRERDDRIWRSDKDRFVWDEIGQKERERNFA